MKLFTPISDRKIRIALVGCGRIAKNHFDAIARHTDSAELSDVCDVDPAALKAAVDKTGACGYGTLTSMLENTKADIVALTTPSGLHAEQTVKVATSGRHVLTEKPMATRWTDALNMVRACDEAGVRLYVVKQNRFNATLQLLKRAMEAKRFGRIYMITVNVFWTRPQSYYESAAWRGTREFDGGAFMNQASHYVDLLNWLGGPVESVMAYAVTLARDIEVEDTGVAALKWRNGAIGSINVTMLTFPQNLEGSITILGECGSVRIGGVALNEIQKWQFESEHEMDEQVKASSYYISSVYGFGHALYYGNVIQTLRGEAEPETDGRAGLKSLELLIAMYRSSKDGTKVSLPLEC